MSEITELRAEVHRALLDAIAEATKEWGHHPASLLMLAEAYAWVSNPNQPHGGGTAPAKS